MLKQKGDGSLERFCIDLPIVRLGMKGGYEARAITFGGPSIDTGTGDQHIIDYGEYAFAIDVLTILILDAGIVKRCSFVHLHTETMNFPSKRDLFWMKIVEA